MSRLVHLVADWAADDPESAGEVVARLALAMPDAVVRVHTVDPGDSLAAGCCVAYLTLAGGDAPRLVALDVAPPDGGEAEAWWIARAPGGTLVIGTNVGWAWSFLAGALAAGPCRVDVSARRTGDPRHARLSAAIRHVATGHPHAVDGVASRGEVPPVPARAVAWADAAGNIKTTIAEPPAALGGRMTVTIGRVSAAAVVTDGRPAADGELALARTPLGMELALNGGSAARHFGSPASGTPVSLSPTP